MTGPQTAHELRFLTPNEILTLHETAIDEHGGSHGVRDGGLLESALAMPRQGFSGEYAHAFPFEMVAAYGFHICKNHPFVDGNKRTALAATVVFLRLNGWSLTAKEEETAEIFEKVADGSLDKAALAHWLENRSCARPSMELRDFFNSISFERVLEKRTELISGSNSEFNASLDEAREAFPFLDGWAIQVKAAIDRGDELINRQWAAEISLFLALYRIAEDMGYEW